MRKMLLVLAAVFVVSPAVWGQLRSTRDESWSKLLPPGKDRQLVIESCDSCHDLKVVVEARMNKQSWNKTIDDMIQRGAPIFPDEIVRISAYLAKAFGTAVPKLANVNTAGRKELENLPNMTPAIATRIIAVRAKSGPFKNAEELRQALGMDKKDFDRIRYSLKYSN